MRSHEAMVDAKTLGVILRGSMQICLIDSSESLEESSEWLLLEAGFFLKGVTQLQRLPNFLCNATPTTTVLYLDAFNFEMIGLAGYFNGKAGRRLTFSQTHCGTLKKSELERYIVCAVDLQTTPSSAGLNFIIEGILTREESFSRVETSSKAGSFVVRATIPWSALELRGGPMTYRKDQFIPRERAEAGALPPVPFDGWSNLCRGQMKITETDGTTSQPAKQALAVDLRESRLSIIAADLALQKADGFGRAHERVSFESWLINSGTISGLLLWNADGTPHRRYGELSFSTTGDKRLGAMTHPSGFPPEEVGDPSVVMVQTVETLSFVVDIASEGLELSLSGTLHDIRSPQHRERAVRSRNKPYIWKNFSIKCLIPWMRLALVGNNLAFLRADDLSTIN